MGTVFLNMFSKLLCLAAVAAVALSQDDDAFDVEVGIKSATHSVSNLGVRLAAVERAVGVVADGLGTAERSMRRVAPLVDNANALVEDVDVINSTLINQLEGRKNMLTDKLSTTRESLDAKLKASLAAIKAKMTAQNDAISAELDARIEAVESQVKKVVDDAASRHIHLRFRQVHRRRQRLGPGQGLQGSHHWRHCTHGRRSLGWMVQRRRPRLWLR